ncbi:hypothetical protein L2E82_15601 [Cichorium intybus]|uniref:Uncharacterized protein n=1 Tax=Cichorium intybus TaxID=13427 RepID=A0ACB9F2K8_CICIN|nr:hypothetical protein L2E82_15601 [Cichorium intybus]
MDSQIFGEKNIFVDQRHGSKEQLESFGLSSLNNQFMCNTSLSVEGSSNLLDIGYVMGFDMKHCKLDSNHTFRRSRVIVLLTLRLLILMVFLMDPSIHLSNIVKEFNIKLFNDIVEVDTRILNDLALENLIQNRVHLVKELHDLEHLINLDLAQKAKV